MNRRSLDDFESRLKNRERCRAQRSFLMKNYAKYGSFLFPGIPERQAAGDSNEIEYNVDEPSTKDTVSKLEDMMLQNFKWEELMEDFVKGVMFKQPLPERAPSCEEMKLAEVCKQRRQERKYVLGSFHEMNERIARHKWEYAVVTFSTILMSITLMVFFR